MPPGSRTYLTDYRRNFSDVRNSPEYGATESSCSMILKELAASRSAHRGLTEVALRLRSVAASSQWRRRRIGRQISRHLRTGRKPPKDSSKSSGMICRLWPRMQAPRFTTSRTVQDCTPAFLKIGRGCPVSENDRPARPTPHPKAQTYPFDPSFAKLVTPRALWVSDYVSCAERTAPGLPPPTPSPAGTALRSGTPARAARR